jgi:hypothetical protein
MHQLRPFVLDQLSHIVGDFWEALRLKQELVQPFEIFLQHDVVGDNPRCVDTFRFWRFHFFKAVVRTLWLADEPAQLMHSRLTRKRLRYRSVPAACSALHATSCGGTTTVDLVRRKLPY